MVEKIGHIRNPLTVITVFAAIAEVSGAIVLPFMSENNQGVYIYFLILFPAVLVIVFFITLNFNHKVLYAPSDWRDEANFFRISHANEEESLENSTLDDDAVKLDAQVALSNSGTLATDVSANLNPFKDQTSSHTSASRRGAYVVSSLNHREIRDRMRAAAKRVIDRLGRELNLNIEHDASIQLTNGRVVRFDAVASTDSCVSAIVVKAAVRYQLSVLALERSMLLVESVARAVKDSGKEFILYYVVMVERGGTEMVELEHRVSELVKRYDVDVRLHFVRLDELADAG
jgi:hypothetical protein